MTNDTTKEHNICSLRHCCVGCYIQHGSSMNIVTATDRDNTTTRMQIAGDDIAANLVAFLLRIDNIKHVALDKDETLELQRDEYELSRSSRYLQAFHFNHEQKAEAVH